MLIVGEAHRGTNRFDNFVEQLGVTRHILSARLKQLQVFNILTTEPVGDHAGRRLYRLTARGQRLALILQAIEEWAMDAEE